MYLLMNYGGIQPVETECFCQFCDASVLEYLSTDMTVLAASISERRRTPLLFSDIEAKGGHAGPLWNLFLSSEDDNVNFGEIQANLSSVEDIIRIISLAGSGSSILSFSGIIYHLVFKAGLSSEGKRCQFALMSSKLLFFIFLGGGMLLRRNPWACKMLAGLTHYALLVSFCHVLWFGVRVARLLWQVNNNMAAVTAENQRDRVNRREVTPLCVVWIGMLVLVASCWSYDQFVSDEIFGYGIDQSCLVNRSGGKLYLIVLPTAAMILGTAGAITVSGVQFFKAQNKMIDRKVFYALLKFLVKLMLFQSLQWIFGVALHFTSNQICKYIFEVLVPFEGIFMAASYFSAQF